MLLIRIIQYGPKIALRATTMTVILLQKTLYYHHRDIRIFIMTLYNISDDDNNNHRAKKKGLAIEEVWVVWRWAAIELENIKKVVVLSMNISTHSDVLVLWYSHFYQWWYLLECFHSLEKKSHNVLLLSSIRYSQWAWSTFSAICEIQLEAW